MNTLAQLARLSDQREEQSPLGKKSGGGAGGGGGGTGGGGGIKSTWKKLKEKRMKKKNSTTSELPHIQTDADPADKKAVQPHSPARDKSKKQKVTSSSTLLGTKEEARTKDHVETPSSAEEGSLSRTSSKGDSSGRKEGENSPGGHTSDVEHSDLSPSMSTSKLSSSESATFATHDSGLVDHLPPVIVTEEQCDLSRASDSVGDEPCSPVEQTDSPDGLPVQSVYESFGDEKHRKSLQKIQQFLDSTEEDEPVDLTALQDWDGWTVASRDIV